MPTIQGSASNQGEPIGCLEIDDLAARDHVSCRSDVERLGGDVLVLVGPDRVVRRRRLQT
jgi:hypothetical protein